MLDLEKAIQEVRSELTCPIEDLQQRKRAIFQACVLERLVHSLTTLYDELEQTIAMLESESYEVGIRGLQRYIKGLHTTVISNLDFCSDIIARMMGYQKRAS